MEEFNKQLLKLIDVRAEQRRRERNYYLPYGRRDTYMSEDKTKRILLRCLNGMMRFWLKPYVVDDSDRFRQLRLETEIPGDIIHEFYKGNLDLAAKQAKILFGYLKDHGDIVPLPHHDGYDFDALVEDVRSYVDVSCLWHRFILAYMIHHVEEISENTNIPKVTLKRYADGTLPELGARASLALSRYLDEIKKEEITDDMKSCKKNKRFRCSKEEN